MPLIIEKNDLTKMDVDVVVIPTNTWVEESPGISRTVYKAAGEERLAAACQSIGHLDCGRAIITDGYDLPASYIIHTAIPTWTDDKADIQRKLYCCYQESLRLAARSGLARVAFPLLTSTKLRTPTHEDLQIAKAAIGDFLASKKPEPDPRDLVQSMSLEPTDMTIYLVAADADTIIKASNLEQELGKLLAHSFSEGRAKASTPAATALSEPISFDLIGETVAGSITNEELDALITRQTDTFTDALCRIIKASGASDETICSGANMSRERYYRIVSGEEHSPCKNIVLSLCVGLRLARKDADYLLAKAGYALTDEARSDLIISYYMSKPNSNIHDLNVALFALGEEILATC